MQSIERYVNADLEDIVPIIDGELHYKQFGLSKYQFYCTNDQLEECNKVDTTYKTIIDNLKEEITLLIRAVLCF
jgi:hypothetical protein